MPSLKITDTREAAILCESLGIVCLQETAQRPRSRTSPQTTNSVTTVQKIINLHGQDHAWKVLYALSQMGFRPKHLSGSLIGALSDVLLEFRGWGDRLGDLMQGLETMQPSLSRLEEMARLGPKINGKGSPKRRILLAGYLQIQLLPKMETQDQIEFRYEPRFES